MLTLSIVQILAIFGLGKVVGAGFILLLLTLRKRLYK